MLYSFKGGTDGSGPGALLSDANGNLYGTPSNGGDLNCNDGHGCGVVFKLSPDGSKTMLHAFKGDNGDDPDGLRRDPDTGDLYGVTLALLSLVDPPAPRRAVSAAA